MEILRACAEEKSWRVRYMMVWVPRDEIERILTLNVPRKRDLVNSMKRNQNCTIVDALFIACLFIV